MNVGEVDAYFSVIQRANRDWVYKGEVAKYVGMCGGISLRFWRGEAITHVKDFTDAVVKYLETKDKTQEEIRNNDAKKPLESPVQWRITYGPKDSIHIDSSTNTITITKGN